MAVKLLAVAVVGTGGAVGAREVGLWGDSPSEIFAVVDSDPTEAELAAACPGAQALGRMTVRTVGAPWVGQWGATEIDFLALLETPAPTLEQARSVVA